MRRRYSAVELLAAVLLRCGACAVYPEGTQVRGRPGNYPNTGN